MTENETLLEVVGELKAYADEILATKIDDGVSFGMLIGYAESLTIIKECMSEEQIKKFGLDFDIEKKYLFGGNRTNTQD